MAASIFKFVKISLDEETYPSRVDEKFDFLLWVFYKAGTIRFYMEQKMPSNVDWKGLKRWFQAP